MCSNLWLPISSSSKLSPVRQAHIYVLPVQPHLNLHHQGDPLLMLLHPQHHHVDINTYKEHLQSHILLHHVAPLSKRLNSSLYC